MDVTQPVQHFSLYGNW